MYWQSICEAHCLDQAPSFHYARQSSCIFFLQYYLVLILFCQVQPQAAGRYVWWRLGVGGYRGSGFKSVRASTAHDEKLRRAPRMPPTSLYFVGSCVCIMRLTMRHIGGLAVDQTRKRLGNAEPVDHKIVMLQLAARQDKCPRLLLI